MPPEARATSRPGLRPHGRLVLFDDAGRNPAAVLDLDALALGPLADLGSVDGVAAAPAPGCTPGCAAGPPGVREVDFQRLAELVAVRSAEVDFVVRAVQAEADGEQKGTRTSSRSVNAKCDTTMGQSVTVDEDSLAQAAALLRKRNAIDAELARLVQRPMTSGHLGEWIAAQVFDIELEASAVAAGIDGRFRSGPLQGRTVNIKWYLKREGLLDTTESSALGYYLVLTGPPSAAVSSRGATRPWCIEAVFLFDAQQLRSEQIMRGVKRGVASSVIKQQWTAAEIYPSSTNTQLTLTPQQAKQLKLFAL
jgi:hypothetical protein